MASLSRFLLLVTVILGASVVVLDHYVVHTHLHEFVVAREYNNGELAAIMAARDAERLATNAQYIIRAQVQRVLYLEQKLVRAAELLRENTQEIKLRERILHDTAKQLQTTITEMAELQAGYDDLQMTNYRLQREIEKLRQQLGGN